MITKSRDQEAKDEVQELMKISFAYITRDILNKGNFYQKENVLRLNKEIHDLQRTILNVNLKLIDSLEKNITSFKKDFTAEKTFLSTGGNFNRQRLMNAWDNLCLDYEINTHDDAIIQTYLKHHTLFRDEFFKPISFSRAIDYLTFKQHNLDNYNYGHYLIAKTIFPNMPFKNAINYYRFTKNLNRSQNIFDELTKLTCNRSFAFKPEFNHFYKNTNSLNAYSKGINFKLINSLLSKGEIVGIIHRVDMFNSENPTIEELHSTTIIGSMELCGEMYYIIRNSWGEQSCTNQMYIFEYSSTAKTKRYQNIVSDLSSCYVSVMQEGNILYPSCMTVRCFEEEAQSLKEWRNICDEKYSYTNYQEYDPPFFCDPDGHHIVKEEYLKKEIHSAIFIAN